MNNLLYVSSFILYYVQLFDNYKGLIALVNY